MPGPPSTEYTRGFLVTTDAVSATAYLGVSSGGTTPTNPVNNYYTTNLYVQNGSHNTMIITQYVRMPWVTLTTSGSNVQQINLNAASMCRVYMTNNCFFGVVTNHPGTNISQTIQIALIQNGAGANQAMMTNSGWFLNGSGSSTNAVPTINTNANALTLLTFVTSPTNSAHMLGVPTTIAP